MFVTVGKDKLVEILIANHHSNILAVKTFLIDNEPLDLWLVNPMRHDTLLVEWLKLGGAFVLLVKMH